MDIDIVTDPSQVAALIDPTGGGIAQTLAEIEIDKKKKSEDAAKLAELTEKAKPKAQPLQLTYKWIGTHDCGTEPKTIVVDTESGCYATAYCIKDDMQIKSIKVEKLPIPEPEKPIKVLETAEKPKDGIIQPKKK